jgi:hypothetical protein
MNDEGIYYVFLHSIFPKIHIHAVNNYSSQGRRFTAKRKYYYNLTDDEEQKKQVMETNVVNKYIFTENFERHEFFYEF